ncbi:MAG TPA: kelch repeat-containing protein [Prolixibacteraceae bacterium]|nr:kelch repeat-containing protein [Prolixibacteraceae bacterium]
MAYNSATNQLTYSSGFPSLTQNNGVGFSINGKGYVCAGIYQLGYVLPEYHVYDPVNNQWSKIANLPGALKGGLISPLTFSDNNKAYLFCGQAYGDYTSKSLDYLAYDPVLNAWSVLGNMKKLINFDAWFDNAGFMIGNNIYITGGILYTGFTGLVINRKTWRYNITSNQWTQLADFPVDRKNAIGFSINGKGYIGLGITNDYINKDPKNDFYEYDPAMDKWTRVNVLPTKGGANACVAVIQGKAYVMTPHGSEIWEFDPLKQ